MQKIIVTLFALCLASCSWGKNSTEIDNQNSVAPGSFCYQDNKIYYYTDSNKEDNLYDLKCYNIKTNEKQIIKQLSMTNKFDVIGNEIYYLNYLEKDETPGVYKCDINSPKDSEKKIYSFDSEEWAFMKAYSEYFAVYDGYIYQNRYTMSCTPEDQEQNILLQNINSMNIWQDKIYYNPIEQVGLSCTLHVMNQDGSNDKILVHNEDISQIECNNAWTDTLTKYGGGISNIITYQDKLYFIVENYQKLGYLYCCNTNGKDLKKIKLDSDNYITQFQINQKQIYYISNSQLYKYDMMGKNTTYIADKVSTFYIANNRIYIYDSEFKKQHGGLLYSVDMEGKDMVIIEENMF